jgi:Zn-dependent protease
MKASIKLFRIAGIDIGIHYTWFFIFIFFCWTLAQGYLPQAHPGWSDAAYWIMGTVTALLLFVSVLVHELAHSLVARSRGLPVTSITLFILGGVSNLEEEPKKPMIEFTMALAGPVTSLVLALVFWGISRAIGTVTEPNYVAAVIAFLAYMNLVLGIFNLLPGFPMDGGRVLRSIIWGSTHSLSKATNVAARIGQIFGWALIAYGIFLVIRVDVFSGLWAVFVGWFLTSAADASRKEVTYRERLSGVKVRELMDENTPTIAPETTVQEMVTGIFQKKHDRAVPVCRDERLIGIATIKDVKKIPQDKWAITPVKDIMSGSNLYTVTPDDSLNTALELIAKHDINQVLIKNGEKCAGLLTRADIIRYLQMSRELGIKEKK